MPDQAPLIVRDEQPGDAPAIRRVLEAAFPTAVEADLVDKLRRTCPAPLSLVGVEEEQVVAHLLFTPVDIASDAGSVGGLGLGPLAVAPARQRAGIGTRLVVEGLERLRPLRAPFVVVLGHPEYYPRFGFVPASRHGVRSEWEVADEVFMILVLDSSVADALAGVARYRPEFSE